jgi:hypothetical protein
MAGGAPVTAVWVFLAAVAGACLGLLPFALRGLARTGRDAAGPEDTDTQPDLPCGYCDFCYALDWDDALGVAPVDISIWEMELDNR